MTGKIFFTLILVLKCAGALGTAPRHVRYRRSRSIRDQPLRLDAGSGPRYSDSITGVQQKLPNFELVNGVPAEYALGRALEMVTTVRGRPLDTWPYDVHPDLSDFVWMTYERSRRVLGGTPPATQPSPIANSTLSYIDIYIFVGTDGEHKLRKPLGISIRPGNASISPDPQPAPTQGPGAATTTPMSSPTPLFSTHSLVFAALVTACALCAILLLGGLSWWIAMRRHLKRQGVATHRLRPSSNSTYPRGRSRSPRWRRTSAHSLSFVPSNLGAPTLTVSTRRRVRTADLGSPTTPSHQSSQEPNSESPENSVVSRKRAATLLQTIHTRTIRGSPRIGSSKGSILPEMSSRKLFSPKVGYTQASPRIDTRIHREELPLVEQSRRDDFTNSWCSALNMDPFQSPGNAPGRKVDLPQEGLATNSTTDIRDFGANRPQSPTPVKAGRGSGHRTMSLSELDHSHTLPSQVVLSSSDPNGNTSITESSMLSVGLIGPCGEDTPTPRASQLLSASSEAKTSSESSTGKRSERHETYAERANQIGMAILATPHNTMNLRKPTSPPLELSLDSFFSPKSETEEVAFHESMMEPRFGDVASERMVRIAPSQETIATTYATAVESGASPVTSGDRESSVGHEQLENIGIIGSPSTNHSQMAELDDISSPLLTEPEVEKAEAAETSNQSLTVEYARADQSLRVLDSFPGMLRGSLSYFPEDVELNTPVLPATSRTQLSYREPTDILLLPEEDLSRGYVRLARVESVERQRHSQDLLKQANEAGNESVAKAPQGNESHGTTEDSIISPNMSEQKSTQDDSILSRTKSEQDESADSLESSKVDRSSGGLHYASDLFDSPRI